MVESPRPSRSTPAAAPVPKAMPFRHRPSDPGVDRCEFGFLSPAARRYIAIGVCQSWADSSLPSLTSFPKPGWAHLAAPQPLAILVTISDSGDVLTSQVPCQEAGESCFVLPVFSHTGTARVIKEAGVFRGPRHHRGSAHPGGPGRGSTGSGGGLQNRGRRYRHWLCRIRGDTICGRASRGG